MASARMTRKRIVGIVIKGIAYILLSATAISMIFPFYWMVTSSLKTEIDVFKVPPSLLPIPPQWSNYDYVFNKVNFGLYTLNSIKVAILWTVGVVISSAWAAYGFARVRFWAREVLFMITLAAMMIPGQVTMIPTFILMNKLGWVNKHLPLWLPAFFGSAFGIFLLRQFFMTIPEELLDAARIDGCGPWRLAWDIRRPAIMGFVWFMVIQLIARNLMIFGEPYLINTALGGASFIDPFWSPNMVGAFYTLTLGNFGMSSVVAISQIIISATSSIFIVTKTGAFITDATS